MRLPRTYTLTGVIDVFAAFLMLLLVTISLPSIPTLNIVHVDFNYTSPVTSPSNDLNQVRLGIWSYCSYFTANATHVCAPKHAGYSVAIPDGNDTVIVGSHWTGGLPMHAVATVFTFVALCSLVSGHATFMLAALPCVLFAEALAIIAFATDIALVVHLQNELRNVSTASATHLVFTGAGFWLTFSSITVLAVAALITFSVRRRILQSSVHDPETYQLFGM